MWFAMRSLWALEMLTNAGKKTQCWCCPKTAFFYNKTLHIPETTSTHIRWCGVVFVYKYRHCHKCWPCWIDIWATIAIYISKTSYILAEKKLKNAMLLLLDNICCSSSEAIHGGYQSSNKKYFSFLCYIQASFLFFLFCLSLSMPLLTCWFLLCISDYVKYCKHIRFFFLPP